MRVRGEELGRGSRFLLVGVIGTLIDIVLGTILHRGLGWSLVVANPLAYSAGIINNYLLNRYWVYRGGPAKSFGVQAFQFTLVSLTALVLNTLLVVVLEPIFRATPVGAAGSYLFAKVTATGVGLVCNFTLNRAWTFKAA